MPEIPRELLSDTNRAVLEYLEDKSAHSDLGEALIAALKPLGDVQVFCPDWQQYRYVVASTRNVIFALAVDMQTIAFRLELRLKERALVAGGVAHGACGPEWVSFQLFRADWPRIDLEFWARKAYGFARESGKLPDELQ